MKVDKKNKAIRHQLLDRVEDLLSETTQLQERIAAVENKSAKEIELFNMIERFHSNLEYLYKEVVDETI